MEHKYIDFHTHTNRSDGCLAPAELIALARQAGVGLLAITDHNRVLSDLDVLQAHNPDIRLLHGSEISCIYTDKTGKETELHVVALGVDPENEALRQVLAYNQPDRRPYINAILARLRECGIDLGTYDQLQAMAPESSHFGRMHIAKTMQQRGFVQSVDEAFDVYIGAFGQRRAFVENPLKYASVEQVVAAIRQAGGVAVLAHLYYYRLEDQEYKELVRYFKELAGDDGAMEVAYVLYDARQRAELKALADRYGLMYSAASDFHGQNETETLDLKFSRGFCEKLVQRLEKGC